MSKETSIDKYALIRRHDGSGNNMGIGTDALPLSTRNGQAQAKGVQ